MYDKFNIRNMFYVSNGRQRARKQMRLSTIYAGNDHVEDLVNDGLTE